MVVFLATHRHSTSREWFIASAKDTEFADMPCRCAARSGNLALVRFLINDGWVRSSDCVALMLEDAATNEVNIAVPLSVTCMTLLAYPTCHVRLACP